MTLPRYRLLVVLDSRGPSNLVRLAEALEVNPSTALRMVERLTAAGMIEKTADTRHRSHVRLRLTGAGWQTVRQVNDARRTEFCRIVAKMPAEQRARLVGALGAFTAVDGEPAENLPVLPGWH